MVSAALVTKFLMKLQLTKTEMVAIFIGSCGALMIFHKDIFLSHTPTTPDVFSSTNFNESFSDIASANYTNPCINDLCLTGKQFMNAPNLNETEAEIAVVNTPKLWKSNHLHLIIGVVLSAICGLCNPCE